MKKNQFTFINLCWLILIVFIYFLINILISLGVLNAVYQTVLVTVMINIILAISLNMIIGITGQFSLGHAGFMAIGAYSAGVALKLFSQSTGFYMGIALGMFFSGIMALIVAIPTLRLKGDYLAIATLGFGEIIRIIIQNMKVTNGAAGLVLTKVADWKIVFVFLIISILIILFFSNSAIGRACISVREDEIASETMGINTTKYKIMAFVVGAVIASIAGALYAGSFYVIKPDMFSFNKSIDILVIVVFGGMGSFTGSILSAIIIGIINTALQSFAGIRTIAYGIILVMIMIFRPKGLLGSYEFKLSKFLKGKEENQ